MNSPKEIIRLYEIKPRKKLGQSFLMDKSVIEQICTIAQVTKNDIVVEIGAGIGVLTQELAQNAAKLIAVEVDNKLVGVLKDKLLKYKNVEIYSGDILKFDFETISRSEQQKIKVIGNIPYNISSPVLFRLLSFRKVINSFVIMLQKEVVQRLTAVPGGKDYGVPSVILQMFAMVEKIMDVPAGCFYPVPKVESSVMKGFFLEKPVVDLADEDFFIKLVRDAFAQRRKMLINNLKKSKLLEEFSELLLKESLEITGIDGRRRSETLSIKEFGYLSNILKEKQNHL
ncbi:MAG: ribosomal RNA small subunit methyltransferase A [Deltaproteobacteria bacterium HGW-Deltaproteobacteria-2]|jgi:16S rRNA (adenine1518-N6/adenine1519-N6)-dimethyltransferase|nr:MAG: ribosomal RNA small subunit methyltransferase A [Deltaproteobacteria bacterium HGW-Deltaproteobacteria-2]